MPGLHLLAGRGRTGPRQPVSARRHRLRWLSAALATGLLVGGCGGSSTPDASPTSSARGSSGPTKTTPATQSVTSPPAAPLTAQCRKLTYANTLVFTNTTKTESCTEPHTAYTFAVPTLPSSIAFSGVQIQNQAVQTAAADRCRTAFATFIGGTQADQALARLSFTYFVPDQHGFDLGAHWVRCDVIANQAAKTLGELPRQPEGLLDKADALQTYGVCSTGTPGSPQTLVMCSQPHAYRALAAIRLGEATAPYPGATATLDQGKSRCKDLIANQLQVSGGFTYSWTYPSTSDWAAGQRFGYCWNQTDH